MTLYDKQYDFEDCPCGESSRCTVCGQWCHHTEFDAIDDDEDEVCDNCKDQHA